MRIEIDCKQIVESERVKSDTTKVRNERIDAVRFWLVVIVIAVHVIMRQEFSDSKSFAVIWNSLNLFVIPLFVFISGYYSQKKDKKDFWTSILRLLEPLIIFHVIGMVFYIKHPLSIRSVLSPWYVLWYLLSLIFWRSILQIIPNKILRHKKMFLASAFCVSILAGFLPFDRVLSIQRTLSFMPFFFLGYYMKGRNIFLTDKLKLFCIGFLIVVLVILSFYPHRISDLLCATPYKSVYRVAVRVVFFAVAVPISLAFLNICPKSPCFARQGRMTMQYYIYHAFIIPPNSALIIPPLIATAHKMNIPFNLISATVILIGTVLAITVILKIPFVKILTNPSSLFVKRKKKNYNKHS